MRLGALGLGAVVMATATVAVAAPKRKPARAPAPALQEDLIWDTSPPALREVPSPPPVTPELRAEGARLYAERCQGCHGERGNGRGPLSERLAIAPTDFTAGVFKVRTTLPGTPPSDDDLFRTVTRGLHGTPMMPWRQLSVHERWALVTEIKAFSRRFANEPRPQALAPNPLPPDENEAMRVRGKALYALYRCGACHGERGDANGPASVMYRNRSSGRFVRIRDFSRGEFVRGSEFADIFLSLRTGFDGTPMGSYNDLPHDDLWALAAHVRTLVPPPVSPPAGTPAPR